MSSNQNSDFLKSLVPATEKPETYRYIPGHPLTYRFNGSSGALIAYFLGNEYEITKKGFSFVPLGYRFFKAIDLFGKKRKDGGFVPWVEFFFANKGGNIGSVLFHGFSVESLKNLSADLSYQESDFPEYVLNVEPDSFQISTPEGIKRVFKAVFSVGERITEDWEPPAGLYRADSCKPGQIMDKTYNFPDVKEIDEFSEAPEIEETEEKQE